MLELAILGLLKEQELHGYELKKRLAETLGVGSGERIEVENALPLQKAQVCAVSIGEVI